MLQSFQHSDFATQFHKTYYLTLMQEIFAVMTGTPICLYQLCGFMPLQTPTALEILAVAYAGGFCHQSIMCMCLVTVTSM